MCMKRHGSNSCRRRSVQGLAVPFKVDVHVSSSSHFASLLPRCQKDEIKDVDAARLKQKPRSADQFELNTDIKLDVDIRDIRCLPQAWRQSHSIAACAPPPDETSWTGHMHPQWTFYPLWFPFPSTFNMHPLDTLHFTLNPVRFPPRVEDPVSYSIPAFLCIFIVFAFKLGLINTETAETARTTQRHQSPYINQDLF